MHMDNDYSSELEFNLTVRPLDNVCQRLPVQIDAEAL
jgi:hypothetical protein